MYSIQSETKEDFSGESTFLSFKLSYDSPGNPQRLEARKLSLLAVVTERNKLIHQDLAFLDTSSIEEYRSLIGMLDEQNPRLLAHLKELGWIIESLGEGLKCCEEFLKSQDFLSTYNEDDLHL